MKRSLLRLTVEALAWVMIVAGAFYVFRDQTLLIHYCMFVIGIIMIGFYFPYIDFKRNQERQGEDLINDD